MLRIIAINTIHYEWSDDFLAPLTYRGRECVKWLTDCVPTNMPNPNLYGVPYTSEFYRSQNIDKVITVDILQEALLKNGL